MKNVAWRSIDRDELAALLRDAPQLMAHAVGTTTVYRVEHEGREVLAIALPDGKAIVLEQAARTVRRRRQVDISAHDQSQ